MWSLAITLGNLKTITHSLFLLNLGEELTELYGKLIGPECLKDCN